MSDYGFLTYEIGKDGKCKKTDGVIQEQAVGDVRSIRNNYIGNKKKMLPSIVKPLLNSLKNGGKCLDIFGGSGVVSLSVAKMSYPVVYNDILATCVVNIESMINPISDKSIDIFFELLESKHSDIYFKISDKYLESFTNDEVSYIENFFTSIVERWGHPRQKNPNSLYWWSFIQNYIMYICFCGGRLNNNQILSSYKFRRDVKEVHDIFNYERIYKYFQYYNKVGIANKKMDIECINSSFNEINISSDVSVVYIDPPYGDALSNYGYMYSFFEEIYYQKSYADICKDKPGLSMFYSTKKYENNIRDVVNVVSDVSTIVFSYNNSGYLSIGEIVSILRDHDYLCDVEIFDYKYKYRQKYDEGTKSKEYLIVANK